MGMLTINGVGLTCPAAAGCITTLIMANLVLSQHKDRRHKQKNHTIFLAQ